jgi:quinolinate synthase
MRGAVLRHADFHWFDERHPEVSRDSEHDEFIIATEEGILHQMQKDSPGKDVHSGAP